MSERSWIHNTITLIKYTLIAVIFWYIIGAGWSGWYDWFCKKRFRKVDSQKAEEFGNKVFLVWLLSVFLEIFLLFNTEDFKIVIIYIFRINIIFFIVSFIGFMKFWKKV